MAIECIQGDPKLLQQLQAWTFPAYRPLLDLKPTVRPDRGGGRIPILPLAFVAQEEGKPLGMVLGCVSRPADGIDSVPDMPNEPELLSVYVDPAARHRGVANLLLEKLEHEVSASFSRISTTYMTGKTEIEFLEKLLQHRGWSPPILRMYILKGPLEKAKALPWYQKYSLGEAFEFFPWCDVTPAEMDALKVSHQKTNWIAEDLKPWYYDTTRLEPVSSLGIRYKGEIVGWMINHRLAEDMVRFTCAFMRRDLACRAWMVIIFSESIERAYNAGFRRLTLACSANHPEMVRFARRRCALVASYSAESRGSYKELHREEP